LTRYLREAGLDAEPLVTSYGDEDESEASVAETPD
jgi:hypothetical protein